MASELARRHPSLGLLENWADPVGSVLELHGEVNGRKARIGFSRVVGIRIGGREDFRLMPPELLEQESAHAVVKTVEAAAGLGAPPRTERTRQWNIGPAVIAWLMNAAVNSRYSWTVRGERPDDPHVAVNALWLGDALRWPSVHQLRERWRRDAERKRLYRGPAHSQAWLLMRDLAPVVVLDHYGWAHTERSNLDLLARYRESQRSIPAVATEVLGTAMK